MFLTVFTGFQSLSKNTASIGNLMKKVWIALHRSITIPEPGGSPDRPISPFMRAQSDAAFSTERTPGAAGLSNGTVRTPHTQSDFTDDGDASGGRSGSPPSMSLRTASRRAGQD